MTSEEVRMTKVADFECSSSPCSGELPTTSCNDEPLPFPLSIDHPPRQPGCCGSDGDVASANITPQACPKTCRASSSDLPANLNKKVDFSPWTASSDISDTQQSLRPLPPSRECRSSKSILKVDKSDYPFQEEIAEDASQKIEGWESALRQLAQDNRQTKIQAYVTLASNFRTVAELSDIQERKEKVQTLLTSILEDVELTSDSGVDPSQINLMLQSLKLLVIIVWDKRLAVDVTDAQAAHLLEASIKVLQQHTLPKAVLLHHLHFLSTQDFNPKVMTKSRAIRLLEIVKTIPQYVKGNGIILERLMLYSRLFEQARNAFKSGTSCWMEPLLMALTSPIINTRIRAVKFGFRAATVLGALPSISSSLREILESVGTGAGDTLNSTTGKQLTKMLRHADEARHVPQAWIIIMLLIRSLDDNLQDWPRLHDWLRIIQKCFNSSDANVRIEANKAWDKFVFVVRPDRSSQSFLSKMLMKPILIQLERPVSQKQSQNARNSAFASYCNLLYYSLHPSATHEHYDTVWSGQISATFKRPFLTDGENANRACRILAALCWKSTISPWRHNRALEAVAVEPEELPTLDCKWVRSRIPLISNFYRTLFGCNIWGPVSTSNTSYIVLAWRNFMRAINSAGQKEIIASADTATATIHITDFLVQLCQQASDVFQCAQDDYISRLHLIIKIASSEIEQLAFGNITARNSEGSPLLKTFSSKVKAPILEFWDVIRHSSDIELHRNKISDILVIATRSSTSSTKRIHALRQFAESTLPAGISFTEQNEPLWNAIAKVVSDILQAAKADADKSDEIEGAIKDLAAILNLGTLYPTEDCEAWVSLAEHFFYLLNISADSRLPLLQLLRPCRGEKLTIGSSRCLATALDVFLSSITIPEMSEAPDLQNAHMSECSDETATLFVDMTAKIDLQLGMVARADSRPNESTVKVLLNATIFWIKNSPPRYRLPIILRLEYCLGNLLCEQRFVDGAKEIQEKEMDILVEGLRSTLIEALGQLDTTNNADNVCKLACSILGASDSEGQMALSQNMVPVTDQTDIVAHDDSSQEEDLEGGGSWSKESDSGDMSLQANSPNGGHLISESNTASKPCLENVDSVRGDNQQDCADECITAENALPSDSIRSPAQRDDFMEDGGPLEDTCASEVAAHSNQTVPEKTSNSFSPNVASKLVIEDEIGETPDEDSKTAVTTGGESYEKHSDLGYPGTPSLPTRRVLSYEQAIRESPTPRSKQQTLRLDEIEYPSSPHSVAEVDAIIAAEAAPRKSSFSSACAMATGTVSGVEFSCGSPEEVTPKNTPVNIVERGDYSSASFADNHLQQVSSCTGELTGSAENDEVQGTDMQKTSTNKLDISYSDVSEHVPMMVDPAKTPCKATDRDLTNGASSITETAVKTPGDEQEASAAAGEAVETIENTEIDFWSASQLSMELETAADSVVSAAEGATFGKRKQGSSKQTKSKRRRTRTRTSSNADELQQESSRFSNTVSDTPPSDAEEIFDCIEVVSRRSNSISAKEPPKQAAHTTGSRELLPERNRKAMPTWSGIVNASKSDSLKVHESAGTAARVEIKSEEELPVEEALRLLQGALASLRKTQIDRATLRTVDDLVFEIRTEAQKSAQRMPGNDI